MNKISRRDAIKAFASAGAFLFALPHLPRILGLRDLASDYQTSTHVGMDPLVVVVRNREMVAFEGLKQYTVRDAVFVRELIGMLRSRIA